MSTFELDEADEEPEYWVRYADQGPHMTVKPYDPPYDQ